MDRYRNKLVTVEEALQKIKSNDVIFCGLAACEPSLFLGSLHLIKDQVQTVSVITGILGGDYPFYSDPGMYGHFINKTWMYTSACRAAHNHQTVSYLPVEIHKLGHYLLGAYHPSVFVGCATPMDRNGHFSLSLSTMIEKECIEQADLIILEVNRNLPRTYGDTHVHISQVDLLIESENPIPIQTPSAYEEKDRIIGEYVADLVEDGSTIQLGVGGIPAAVAQNLYGKHDLGMHSGLMNDSLLDLYEAGVINNRKKSIWKDKFVTCMALGSQRLYQFLDHNMAVEFQRGSVVNSPAVIARNNKMFTINTTNQMDLTGQCCAETIGSRQFSGTGGHKEWLAGASESPGGKSVIAFHSTLKNDSISRIVPFIEAGSVVTSSRVDIHYVVTEYGVACIRGHSIRERVNQLIGIAHPNWRDYLRFEARKNQIW